MFVGSVEVISSNSMGSTLWGLGHVQYLLDVQVGQSSWIVYRRYSQFRDLDKSIRSVLGAEFLENEEINKGESGFNAELPPSNTIGMTRPQITSARLPSLNEYIRCATSFQAPEKSKSSIEALFCEFLDREHRGKSGMRISGSSVKRETFAKVSYPRNLLWRNVFIGLTSDGLLYVCKDLTTLAENADIIINLCINNVRVSPKNSDCVRIVGDRGIDIILKFDKIDECANWSRDMSDYTSK
jgi:hypothetical protein